MGPTTQQIYQQGQNQANQFNAQSQQYARQFGTFQDQTNQAQQNLQAYTNNMADPAQLYSQYLGNAQQMYGFNPQDLLRASKALANTNTTLANLPQAAQQQGNYYGTTAGAQANNYQQQAGNLNSVLQGQGNAMNAYQNVLAATQQQANQQATLGFQGEQLKSSNLENIYNNALAQQKSASDQMDYFANLYQQQGSLTAQQAAQYAAAQASYAQAGLAAAQAAQINQQVSMAGQVSDQLKTLYGNNPQAYAQALLAQTTGQNISLPSTTPSAQASSNNRSATFNAAANPLAGGGSSSGGGTSFADLFKNFARV